MRRQKKFFRIRVVGTKIIYFDILKENLVIPPIFSTLLTDLSRQLSILDVHTSPHHRSKIGLLGEQTRHKQPVTFKLIEVV